MFHRITVYAFEIKEGAKRDYMQVGKTKKGIGLWEH